MMGEPQKPFPVKLVVGMISSQETLFARAKKVMEEKFGPMDFESPLLDFNYTAYYEKEMGAGLKRQFISFKDLIRPETLPAIKLLTNNLEKDFASGGKRQINLDPGYLTLDKFVLATTKNHQHRIYLNDGIYAEATLRYRNRSFHPWECTYPDYRTGEYIGIFNALRELYRRQIRKGV
jgi:hypothetical protein